MTSLNSQCYGYVENGNMPCEDDCDSMNRWPITRASQMEYQVIRLERASDDN